MSEFLWGLAVSRPVLCVAALVVGVVFSQKLKDVFAGVSAQVRAEAQAEADKVIAAAKAKLAGK